MSPRYREVPKSEEAPRSIWSTPLIFLALGLLTGLMGLLIYAAVRGPSGGAVERSAEIRATR